jgi:hypothetical protein
MNKGPCQTKEDSIEVALFQGELSKFIAGTPNPNQQKILTDFMFSAVRMIFSEDPRVQQLEPEKDSTLDI